MALNPCTTLMNGRYRILRLLGRGGFGFVYLAQDTLMDEEVAIKELIPALIDDETALKRFITEAKAAMRLRHPNIVATYNVFADGENYYLVMEYMAGGSLEDLLRRQGKLEIAQALKIIADICAGLVCAHSMGIIHCDIKPANVLFAAEGTAKLTDFGIAYISPELVSRSWRTPRDFAAGTLLYMAPEQVDGVRDDPRMDIYALGAMLYQMLTGRPYLEFDLRETPGAQADNVNLIRHQMPVPPRTVNPVIPKWLEEVVLKALTKEPGKRYGSAGAFAAALGQALRLRETEVVQEPVPRFGQVPLWPLLGALAAVLVVVLIFAIPKLISKPEMQEIAIATVQPQTAITQTVTAQTTVAATQTAVIQPTATRTATPTATVAQATATWTATAALTPTPTTTPTPMPTTTLTPTMTPTPTPTTTPTPTLTATTTPTDTPVPPTPTFTPPPLSGLMVENAEGYDSDATLNATYQINDAWGANEGSLRLVGPPHTFRGTQAIAFWFNIRNPFPDDYSGFERNLPAPQDWSAYSHLCLWVENDGSIYEMVMQFGERSREVWKHMATLSTGAQEICLPLSENTFYIAEWSPSENGQIDLEAINYYGIYVHRSRPGSGTIHIDEIRVANR